MFCYVNFFSYICKKYINVMKQEERLEEAKRLYKDANADQRYVLESEDEKIRKEIANYFKHYSGGDNISIEFPKWIAWLEKQAAWSKEDTETLNGIVNYLFTSTDVSSIEGSDKWYDWLKSLKNRVIPKQEWDEEDERIYKSITYSFANNYPLTVQQQEFVKSLRPQNKWKPSDEQIEALESATENCAYSEYQDCLRELIGQLKKLK